MGSEKKWGEKQEAGAGTPAISREDFKNWGCPNPCCFSKDFNKFKILVNISEATEQVYACEQCGEMFIILPPGASKATIHIDGASYGTAPPRLRDHSAKVRASLPKKPSRPPEEFKVHFIVRALNITDEEMSLTCFACGKKLTPGNHCFKGHARDEDDQDTIIKEMLDGLAEARTPQQHGAKAHQVIIGACHGDRWRLELLRRRIEQNQHNITASMVKKIIEATEAEEGSAETDEVGRERNSRPDPAEKTLLK